MPITVRVLDAIATTTDATSFLSSNVQPVPGELLLAHTASGIAVGTAPGLADATGPAGTFTERKAQLYSANQRRLSVASLQCGASPAAGQFTWTMQDAGSGTTSTCFALVLLGVQGHDPIEPFAYEPQGAATAAAFGVTAPLRAAAFAESRAFAWAGHRAQEATDPNTNWTELADLNHAGPPMGYEAQWRTDAFGDDDAVASWATSAVGGIIGYEIVPPMVRRPIMRRG